MKPIDLSVKSQSTMVGNDGGVGRTSAAGRVRLHDGNVGLVALMTLLTAFLV